MRERAVIPCALLVALAGACGRDEAVMLDGPDAPELTDAPIGDGELVDTPDPVDASPVDAEIIDAPMAVCEPLPTPPTLDPTAVASGTRLVPRTVAEPVAGGVEVPHAIWDSALGITCEPMGYHDGVLRCVPPAADIHLLGGQKFADAARTIPVAVEPLAHPTPVGTLSAVYSGGGFGGPFNCGSTRLTHFSRFGALRGGTAYYRELGGPETVPAGYGIFDLTLVPDDFVALTEIRTQLSGPIAVRELRGADGSRLFATDLWDTAHDIAVVLLDVDGGHWLLPHTASAPWDMRHLAPPPGVALGGVVDNAWCATHDDIFAAPTPSSTCPAPPPRFVTDDERVTHEVVPQTATLYGCGDVPGVDAPGVQVLTYQTRAYLASCREVPRTEWQEAIAVTEGAGRLTTTVYSIGGAPFERDIWRQFADAGLGMECTPRTAKDGSLRCLPIRHGMVTFADAACTTRVVAHNGQPVTYAFEGTEYSNGFPDPRGDITVYGVGAVRPAGPIYTIAPSGCVRVDNWTSYELGPEIPPSVFVELELRDAP